MKFFYGFMASVLVFISLSVGVAGASEVMVRSEPQLATESVSQEEVVIHYFDDPLCSVCAEQKDFLQALEERYQNLTVVKYDISDTNQFHELATERGITDYRIMAPSTFIGNQLLQFSSFGERQEAALVAAIEGSEQVEDNILRLPVIGTEIDTDDWSLPILAAVLGSLDGFNVCSLGALILILSIVLVFNSRKKIFLFGGIFIFTTVLVYGGLVFVWGQLIDMFIGQLGILRLLVGLAALGGSFWFFKEFWRFYKYGPTCESSKSKIVQRVSQKLVNDFNETGKGVWLLAGSIMLFAFVVTIVELPCSIGVPIAFTGILVESGVSLGAYTLYIMTYLFFYMFIEIVIFTGAVLTKEIWFAGSRTITWTTFVGAVILLLLAVYYLLAV